MSSLYEWLADHDCRLLRSSPRTALAGETHIVEPNSPARRFQGPRFERLDDDGLIVVSNHPSTWPYEQMPRFWRMQLFPSNFARWPEAEHQQRGNGLTWQQQQAIWQQRDAWEAYFDGDFPSLDACREYLATLPPLPDARALGAMIATVARSMTARRGRAAEPVPGSAEKPDITPEQEAHLLGMVRPVPETITTEQGEAA